MGALSNSGRKTANFAGFYKGIQSAGAAIAWRIDAMEYPYLTQFAITWSLLAGSLVVAAPVIFLNIKEATSIDDDLIDTDLNYADIMPQAILLDEDKHYNGGHSSSTDTRRPFNPTRDDMELPHLRHEKNSEDMAQTGHRIQEQAVTVRKFYPLLDLTGFFSLIYDSDDYLRMEGWRG